MIVNDWGPGPHLTPPPRRGLKTGILLRFLKYRGDQDRPGKHRPGRVLARITANTSTEQE